ncbi:MAG: hypothetical protein COB46_05480 [Rhodospirillaceae bacterium]|nr:MAG: hypothetical protein COB46_05480 [Rhodospirillaceae bacterium]
MKVNFALKILFVILVISILFVFSLWATLNFWGTLQALPLALIIVAEIVFWGAICALALEFFARRRNQVMSQKMKLDIRHHPQRMVPHPFVHFLPSNNFEDITDHFRGAVSCPQDHKENAVYLAGDCTLFEDHLPQKNSLAALLAEQLTKKMVLNAATSHYTILHAFNRLVFDLMRGYRPSVVVVCSGPNDVLSFVHHKNGVVDAGHTHMYKAWGGQKKSKSVFLNSFLERFLGGAGGQWGQFAVDITPDFYADESILKMREIYTSLPYRTCLELFHATCEAMGARLVLVTSYFHHEEKEGSAREAYAWGIDNINQEIREFGLEKGVVVADMAKDISFESEIDVSNKWHYTEQGNLKRSKMLSNIINTL